MRWYTAIGMKKDDADGRFCVWVDGEEKVLTEIYLQGNEKCSNSPETDRKERGRFLYECGQTGKSAGTFQSDGGVK